MPKWLKTTFKIAGAVAGLIILLFIILSIYVALNKQKVLGMITAELNSSINGTLTIGSIDPTLLKGLPGVSVTLKNVVIKDNQWTRHHHTLLSAKIFDVSVNTLALLSGTIDIDKIDISDADIDLFTDSSGYSNTSIFKIGNKAKTTPGQKGSSSTQIRRFTLSNVNFVVDDRKAYKLFKFEVNDVSGKINYPDKGWDADIKLKMLVKSFSFNTRRGSFIKNKLLQGPFDISYNNKTQIITVAPNKLNIGDDPFTIGATFNLGTPTTDFTINVAADDILWTSAANLLAANITKSLNMFNIKNPIAVTANIGGSFGAGGDPSIFVTCKVKDNAVTAPGVRVDNCSFNGTFSNNYINGKGLGDDNSVIKLYHFTGDYHDIPFTIDTAFINNLNTPVATGVIRAHFPVTKLNPVIGVQNLKFTRGTADIRLAYQADMVNYNLTKPKITGTINIKNTDVNYVPRNLLFKNNSISLKFTQNDLLINNIRLQNGSSVVYMEGRVNNFLNLYYTAPEKILLTWQITSPQLHLGEFLGFLNSRQGDEPAAAATSNNTRKTNLTSQLNTAFDKGQAELHLRVAKVYYKKFLATNATADILLADNSIKIRNVSVKHADGLLKLSGLIVQKGKSNTFAVSTTVTNVNTGNFFYSFDNFGLQSLTSKNLRGFLSARADIVGGINNAGSMIPGSLKGDVSIDFKQGALINFAPIKSVGKFAFPFRNLDSITFSNLKGNFRINGDKINIAPMQISSSVLNMDIAGVYSLSSGTNIALDIPLRNPKNDVKIADDDERDKKRMRGIVLHILATDGENGKIKLKWNKNRDKDKNAAETQNNEDVKPAGN